MNLEPNFDTMNYRSRHSFRTVFALGMGTGIIINTLYRKLTTSTNWSHKVADQTYTGLKQRIQNFKSLPSNLLSNPLPDLYRATDSLTLSEEDLIHASA